MDIVDSVKRSAMMAGIRSKNTQPEMQVRRFLHARGFRYLLHDKKLPGRPDIVLPKYQTVVFVHGCFWHQHNYCKYAAMPSSNSERWKNKFAANIVRDAQNISALHTAGWRVIVVWECELRGVKASERLPLLAKEIGEIVKKL